jgi:hypothetical protein
MIIMVGKIKAKNKIPKLIHATTSWLLMVILVDGAEIRK